MNIMKEPIHYQNPMLHIKVSEFTIKSAPSAGPPANTMWYYHKEVEFLFIRSGVHGMHTVNQSYILNPGDVMVIGASQPHWGNKLSEEDLVYIVLHVDLQHYFDPPMMTYYQSFSEVRNPLEELNGMFRADRLLRDEVAGCRRSLPLTEAERRFSYPLTEQVGYNWRRGSVRLPTIIRGMAGRI